MTKVELAALAALAKLKDEYKGDLEYYTDIAYDYSKEHNTEKYSELINKANKRERQIDKIKSLIKDLTEELVKELES